MCASFYKQFLNSWNPFHFSGLTSDLVRLFVMVNDALMFGEMDFGDRDVMHEDVNLCEDQSAKTYADLTTVPAPPDPPTTPQTRRVEDFTTTQVKLHLEKCQTTSRCRSASGWWVKICHYHLITHFIFIMGGTTLFCTVSFWKMNKFFFICFLPIRPRYGWRWRLDRFPCTNAQNSLPGLFLRETLLPWMLPNWKPTWSDTTTVSVETGRAGLWKDWAPIGYFLEK